MSKISRFDLEYMAEPEVRRYCGPIFFTRSTDVAAGNVIANGSFGLIETSGKKLLVTCSHVFTEFKKCRNEDPTLKMCLCLDHPNPVIFTPEAPVWQDERLDLVAFGMAPYLEACGGREFYQFDQRRPRKIATGDALIFIGFPGHGRTVNAGGALGFLRSPFGVRVHDTSSDGFIADISMLSLSPDEFGGVSGCPCFLTRQGRPLLLAGFATSVWQNYLRFTHANCLKSVRQ